MSVAAPATADRPAATAIPGFRTLRSRSFRTVLAAVLLAIGGALVGRLLFRQASLGPAGEWALDFGVYFTAASRVLEGSSPYRIDQLQGPISALCERCYLYPPVLAQALQPLTALSLGWASVAWFALQGAAIVGALWVATGVGGARRTIERALWCGVATLFFVPAFTTLWQGNVGGFVALSGALVALGGAWAGIGAAAGMLLKVVPGVFVPVAIVMDPKARRAVLFGVAGVVALSFALAPGAWLEYPVVLRNLMEGEVYSALNIAPASVALRLGAPEAIASAVRVATIVLAAICMGASVSMARRPDGLRVAAALGAIALLLLPGAMWYHYLVILLPFAAMAWPQASSPQRGLLFVSAALTTLSLLWLPLALFAAIAMASLSVSILWPAKPEAPSGRLGQLPSAS